MDQDELQTNNQQTPSTPSDAASPSASSQIFDISDDNISPISSDVFAYGAEPEPAPPSTPILTPEGDKRSTPPQEEEMLDQKIGSFDATPFAPSVAPVMPNKVAAPQPNVVRVQNLQQNAPEQIKPAFQPVPQPIPRPVIQKQPQPTYQSGPIIVKSQQPVPIKQPAIPVMPDQQRARSLQDEIAAALHMGNIPTSQTDQKQPSPTSATAQQSLGVSPAEQPAPSLTTTSQNQAPDHEGFARETIKPVRTYEGDVAEAMSHKRASSASIAIAESKRQQGSERVADETPSHAGRKIVMMLISLLLLGGGAFGAYYLYSKSALAPVTPVVQQQQAAPSIIPSDSQSVLTISSQSPNLIRQSIVNQIEKPQQPGTIREIVIATKDASGQLVRVPAVDMIKNLDINAPDILTRSLTANWMLGVYNSPDNDESVFIVGSTNFFQNTFAGMLQWERLMADDLRQFLYPDNIEGVLNETGTPRTMTPQNPLSGIDSILPFIGTTTIASGTSTTQKTATSTATKTSSATSTRTNNASTTQEVVAPLRQYLTIRGKFEDRIVKNKDVRAFRADNGQIIFLYSFIDNNKLVITDKESTLAEVLTRLEKQSFIR